MHIIWFGESIMIEDNETSRSFSFPCSMSILPAKTHFVYIKIWFIMMILLNQWLRNVSIIFLSMFSVHITCQNTLSKHDDLINQFWFWSYNDDETSRSFFFQCYMFIYAKTRQVNMLIWSINNDFGRSKTMKRLDHLFFRVLCLYYLQKLVK